MTNGSEIFVSCEPADDKQQLCFGFREGNLFTCKGVGRRKPEVVRSNVVLDMSLSLREDVKLREKENAWKPRVMMTVDIHKSVLIVLNKLTAQKFDKLVSQVKALPIDSFDELTGVINLVFEKAVNEPGYSVAYALMCKVLSDMKVPAESKTPEDPEFVNFRKLIVNRCQTECGKITEAELYKDANFKEINLQTDPEKKKELLFIYEEEERKIRMKSVGTLRFIGELFKLKMLKAGIMHRCISQLLSAGDELSLECLCTLLTTIGKGLESKGQSANSSNDLTPYFNKMSEIAGKRGPGTVSRRVRFMLQGVIEPRQSMWMPRRDDANRKTMDQIQKEAEKKTMDMHIALNSNQKLSWRNDDRGGGGNMGDCDRRAGNKNRVIELRQSTWMPLRDDANRKTMDQIQKEAEKETMDMHIALNSNQKLSWRNDDRGGGGNMGDCDRRAGNKNRVIELCQSAWMPRRDDANRKTMDQIQKEAEKETMDMHIALNSNQKLSWRNDDRGGGGNMGDCDRRAGNKNQRGDSQQSDGWTNVPARTGRNLVADPAEMKVNKNEMEIIIGNTYQFQKWSRGVGSWRSEEEKSASQPHNSNAFSVLHIEPTGDDKRPPPLMLNQPRLASQKFTLSPSMEKERMLASFKQPSAPDVHSSRSAGGQQTSRPSSRDNSSWRTGLGSQPGSVNASNEDISRVQPDRLAASSKLASKLATELSFEEVQKKSKLVVDELLQNNLILDGCENVQETFIVSQMHEFVRESINVVLEKTAHCRQNVSQLMCTLIKKNIITSKQYLQGMAEVLDVADNIAIDVPKVLVYLAESIVPILSSELVSYSEFLRLVGPPSHTASILLAEVLKLLIDERNERNRTAKRKNLESLDGGKPTPATSQLTMEEIYQKLSTFLTAEPLHTSFDPACDWIEANVSERVKEPQFIRVLMTVICEKSIHQSNTTWRLEEKKILSFDRLITKYVDYNEELELQCIYAVQALIHRLGHPQGLMHTIFQALSDNGIFSNDSFISWETSSDPAEHAGRDVALKSVALFYSALKEPISSCDES